MALTAPSPLTWTLRFKYHKSTTLLHVEPLQSFISIKGELLRALRQTHKNGRLSDGTSIPDAADEVILAKPVDISDHNQGWTRIEDPVSHAEELEPPKAAGSSKKRKLDVTSPMSCPQASGLKEGSVLAYKFSSGGQDDEGLGLEDEVWDVVIPNYDHTAGVTNEGDIGRLPNLEGR